jgi:hypothetical protein
MRSEGQGDDDVAIDHRKLNNHGNYPQTNSSEDTHVEGL